jgi:glycosyltransferase involved in cell wall biosynthesis
MARPVIATDVPGCRSVVDDGRNGYLCASRSAESLARACRRFLNVGHALQQQMGLAGRHKIEQSYDQRLVLEFYRDIIARLGSDEAQADLTSMTPARGYG